MKVKHLADLCEFFCADDPRQMNKRIYKSTQCGASISLYFSNREGVHNGTWKGWPTTPDDPSCTGFSIQTIVEGCDYADVSSGIFTFPVEGKNIDAWIEEMEMEAENLWREANLEDEVG